MSIVISFGRWGKPGYLGGSYARRLCLGWVSILWFPADFDWVVGAIYDDMLRRGLLADVEQRVKEQDDAAT